MQEFSDSGVNSGQKLPRKLMPQFWEALVVAEMPRFAQGGGKDTSKKDEAIAKAKSMILG